jgi:uncharacterized protein YfiM (DUF2279 family)
MALTLLLACLLARDATMLPRNRPHTVHACAGGAGTEVSHETAPFPAPTIAPFPAPTIAPFPVPTITPVLAQRAQDAWLGADKVRHLFAAYAVTAFTFGGARLIGVDRDASAAAGAVAGVLASFGKELADRSQGGPFSVRDLVWDLIGIGAGFAIVQSTR